MKKKLSESPSRVSSSHVYKEGGEKTSVLTQQTKDKIWRVLGIAGVGTLGVVAGAAAFSNPLIAGLMGGVGATLYQQKTKK